LVAEISIFTQILNTFTVSIGFPVLGQQAAEFEDAIRKGADTESDKRFNTLKVSHETFHKR
jgi:hypothetical protein